jgi:hypothetical protein
MASGNLAVIAPNSVALLVGASTVAIALRLGRGIGSWRR